jgi:AraC-like DNA-binding protein
MSLSTFKRHFIVEYNEAPGKWLQDKRLQRAKEILKEGQLKASDIYQDMGYNNLSNFSIAFKNKFGKVQKKFIETKKKRNNLKTNKLRFVHICIIVNR